MGRNTIFSGKFTRAKLKATVINAVWPELLFFTLIATSEWFFGLSTFYRVLSWAILSDPVVALVDEFTNVKLAFNNQLLTVLGVVLGLVISFRTSSAYER